MKSQVQQRKDAHTKIYNGPIESLKTVKEHALNYQESLYKMEVIDDALIIVLLIKQRNEPLYEYVQKIKTVKEITKSYLRLWFEKCIKLEPGYSKEDIKK